MTIPLSEQIAAVQQAIEDYGDPHPLDEPTIEALRAALQSLEGYAAALEKIPELTQDIRLATHRYETSLAQLTHERDAACLDRDMAEHAKRAYRQESESAQLLIAAAHKEGLIAGWLAASAALGYEARKESAMADVASLWWAAAVWLEQNQDNHHLRVAVEM